MRSIDLNCDLGEGCGNDAELMRYISSANIACGFHAGDSATMHRTAELAVANGVAIGAHPGYADPENFGRTALSLPSAKVYEIVREQVLAMKDVCESLDVELHHVKAHGAMYNQAARDEELAAAIAEAVASVNRRLVLFGLPGSYLISTAEAAGLRSASEAFADRTYQPDGSLTPRTESNALIGDTKQAVEQVLQIIASQTVTATTGETVRIDADTVCIHGDGPHATEFAMKLRRSLEENGVTIKAV